MLVFKSRHQIQTLMVLVAAELGGRRAAQVLVRRGSHRRAARMASMVEAAHLLLAQLDTLVATGRLRLDVQPRLLLVRRLAPVVCLEVSRAAVVDSPRRQRLERVGCQLVRSRKLIRGRLRLADRLLQPRKRLVVRSRRPLEAVGLVARLLQVA